VLQQLRRALQPAVQNLEVKWYDENQNQVADVQHAPSVLPPVFDGDQLIIYGQATSRIVGTLVVMLDANRIR